MCLKQLVEVAGPTMTDARALAARLGVRSIRTVERALELWRQKLSEDEMKLIMDYDQRAIEPDCNDPFPEAHLRPLFGEHSGPLLEVCNPGKLTLGRADKRTLYLNCVKCLNKVGLNNRQSTAWARRFGGSDTQPGPLPQWTVFYKTPIKKRTGDLQWRIVHGAIACNAFVSRINPAVTNKCPFCDQNETVFHTFVECERLRPLFSVLSKVYHDFGEEFSDASFVYGVGYGKGNKVKGELLNFLSGEAKFAIYMTRKNRVEERGSQDAVLLWQNSIRARILLEFTFFRAMGDLDRFQGRWGYRDIICCQVEGRLQFSGTFAP